MQVLFETKKPLTFTRRYIRYLYDSFYLVYIVIIPVICGLLAYMAKNNDRLLFIVIGVSGLISIAGRAYQMSKAYITKIQFDGTAFIVDYQYKTDTKQVLVNKHNVFTITQNKKGTLEAKFMSVNLDSKTVLFQYEFSEWTDEKIDEVVAAIDALRNETPLL